MARYFLYKVCMASAEEAALGLLNANIGLGMVAKNAVNERFLVVKGEITKRQYFVPLNQRFVYLSDVCIFCVYTRNYGQMPWPDDALTLMLHIQHNERYFLQQAFPRTAGSLKLAMHLLRAGIFRFDSIMPLAMFLAFFFIVLSIVNLVYQVMK